MQILVGPTGEGSFFAASEHAPYFLFVEASEEAAVDRARRAVELWARTQPDLSEPPAMEVRPGTMTSISLRSVLAGRCDRDQDADLERRLRNEEQDR